MTVEAAYSKHRRRDVQPLPADLVPVLRAWLEERTSTGRLWPGKWYRRAAEMLQVDLTRAGVAYMDERGRYLDFHALRHTYITSLHRGGVYGKLLQTLARHSTSRLTERYTHVELSDIAGAIEGLPPLPTAKPKQKKRRA